MTIEFELNSFTETLPPEEKRFLECICGSIFRGTIEEINQAFETHIETHRYVANLAWSLRNRFDRAIVLGEKLDAC